MSPLEVDVLHNEITVHGAGNKLHGHLLQTEQTSRILIAKRMSKEDDRRTSMTLSEFLGSAWWAANV